MGECDKNPGYMLFHCKKSCEQCVSDDSEDVSNILERTSQFGTTQRAEGTRKEETLEVVVSMLEYMESSAEFLSLPEKIKNNCKNKVRYFMGYLDLKIIPNSL